MRTTTEMSAVDLVLKRYRKFVRLLLCISLCTSQSVLSAPPQYPVDIPFWRLGPIGNSGMTEPAQQVVKEAAEFRALWKKVHVNYEKQPRTPAVDFSREVVVLLAMGRRMSTGHILHTMSVVDEGPAIVVTYTTSGSGRPGGIGLPAVSAPAEMLRIEKPTKPVIFRERPYPGVR